MKFSGEKKKMLAVHGYALRLEGFYFGVLIDGVVKLARFEVDKCTVGNDEMSEISFGEDSDDEVVIARDADVKSDDEKVHLKRRDLTESNFGRNGDIFVADFELVEAMVSICDPALGIFRNMFTITVDGPPQRLKSPYLVQNLALQRAIEDIIMTKNPHIQIDRRLWIRRETEDDFLACKNWRYNREKIKVDMERGGLAIFIGDICVGFLNEQVIAIPNTSKLIWECDDISKRGPWFETTEGKMKCDDSLRTDGSNHGYILYSRGVRMPDNYDNSKFKVVLSVSTGNGFSFFPRFNFRPGKMRTEQNRVFVKSGNCEWRLDSCCMDRFELFYHVERSLSKDFVPMDQDVITVFPKIVGEHFLTTYDVDEGFVCARGDENAFGKRLTPLFDIEEFIEILQPEVMEKYLCMEILDLMYSHA
jgi:hypothetical protein